MKIKFLLMSLCVGIALFSCRNKGNTADVTQVDNKPKNVWHFDSLTLSQRIGGIHPDSLNSGVLVSLSLEYPSSTPDTIDLVAIQQSISNAFLGNTNNMKISPEEAFSIKSKTAIDEALEYAEEWKKWTEAGDNVIDISNYNESVVTKIDTIIGQFMVISTTTDSYLGGAHGSYQVKYSILDVVNNQILDEQKLFNNSSKELLAEIIQEKIKQRNKSTNSSNHISLLVKLKDVLPNNNFLITDKGITYVYNQYEISPYAQGVVEIDLSYQDVLPLIKDKYLQPFEDIINKKK